MDTQRYNQLISDLRSDYRPQREWGEGKGLLMVVGHFLVGIAGGAWLLGTLYGSAWTLVFAFVLGGLGGLVHLAFLGHPERAVGMMRHWRTSWVSRGFVGLSLFLLGGVLYLPGQFVAMGAAGPALNLIGGVMAMLGALTIIGYMGFAYTASKAIPFWNSPLHPALYVAYALRGGIAALLIVGAVKGGVPAETLLKLWIGVTAVVGLFFIMELQGAATGGNVAAKQSVHEILNGRVSMVFYGGTLIVGLAVPALLLATSHAASAAVMALIGIASAAGDFFMKLSTVRAGVYLPLVIPARHHRRA